mmetsp:Transcript_10938/g.18572  ORF Transcript_10938/g.18572 Transcript_10938/m.18572 type:complete len:103 (-) Transcript_10938:425-733(-)
MVPHTTPLHTTFSFSTPGVYLFYPQQWLVCHTSSWSSSLSIRNLGRRSGNQRLSALGESAHMPCSRALLNGKLLRAHGTLAGGLSESRGVGFGGVRQGMQRV